MNLAVEISTVENLTLDQQEQIINLVRKASIFDKANPLNEHAELHLKHGGDQPINHVIANIKNQIVGYGHLDQTDLLEGPSAELVVDPDFRNQGIAKLMLREIESIKLTKPLRLWAHGNVAAATHFANKHNYQKVREIIQMRFSLLQDIADFSFTSDFKVACYQSDQDNETLLQINKAAFVELPDQARWTEADLLLRLKESWFNPEGLLILRTAQNLPVAFCWTKIHSHHHQEHEPLGEIYVLAVKPEFHGQGLGRQLALWALHHLRKSHLTQAMLYVDAKNEKARQIYLDLGFVYSGSDTLYKSLT